MPRPSIESVIGQYTDLRRSGRQLRGRCPLHDEKTPSFYIDPDKQVFYCHGCHAGGDVIAFVMAHEGCEFGEAVKGLGMDGDDVKPRESERTERLVALLVAWRARISPMISDRCRRLFLAGDLAHETDAELGESFEREFEVLAGFQESLWTPHGLLEMWAQREVIERIVL